MVHEVVDPKPAAQLAEEEPAVPCLPPEVHYAIVAHVHSADLPNYRLTCKAFAEIGAPQLFYAVTFQCSQASTLRVHAIKACNRSNKHVNTLIWDNNSWIVEGVRDWHVCNAVSPKSRVQTQPHPWQSARSSQQHNCKFSETTQMCGNATWAIFRMPRRPGDC